LPRARPRPSSFVLGFAGNFEDEDEGRGRGRDANRIFRHVLSHAVEGAPVLALGMSALAGVWSINLSPCRLASIPLIVGFISGPGQVTARRASWTSTSFSVDLLAP
jgi:hypothetical protein